MGIESILIEINIREIMKKRINREYFDIIRNKQEIETPLFCGSTSVCPLDEALSIEKQNVLIKEDFLYEDNFKADHLEFTFPVEGRVELEINHKYMNSKADLDLFSLSAFEHESSCLFAKKDEKIKHLAINLSPDIYFRNFNLTKELTKSKTNLYKVSGSDKFISETVQKIYNEEPADIISREETRFSVYELIEYCVNKIKDNVNYHRCINKYDLDAVRNVKKYIDKNFLKKLTLYEISRFSCFNEFKIKKVYKEVYGETIFETIRKKRMNHAINLISTGKYSLNEIAYLCSYESYPSFYKTFKKHFEHSPSEIYL